MATQVTHFYTEVRNMRKNATAIVTMLVLVATAAFMACGDDEPKGAAYNPAQIYRLIGGEKSDGTIEAPASCTGQIVLDGTSADREDGGTQNEIACEAEFKPNDRGECVATFDRKVKGCEDLEAGKFSCSAKLADGYAPDPALTECEIVDGPLEPVILTMVRDSSNPADDGTPPESVKPGGSDSPQKDWGYLTVQVFDFDSKKAVEEITVEVNGATMTAKTNKDGEASFKNVPIEKAITVVTRDGKDAYGSTTGSVTLPAESISKAFVHPVYVKKLAEVYLADVLPDIKVGETKDVPFDVYIRDGKDSRPATAADGVVCTSADESIATVAADCSTYTGVKAGQTSFKAALPGGKESVPATVYVVE